MGRCVLLAVSCYILSLYCILNINCHPQCLDYRPPFELTDELNFCSEYATYGCCTHERDNEIESEYMSMLDKIQQDQSNGNNCGQYIKQILCQECSPYAAHIFDAEINTKRSFPGLCNNFCATFYEHCSETINHIVSDDSEISSHLIDAASFCEYIALTDVDYCYPELLTNAALNGGIEREAITRDGCLCLEQFASGLRNPLSLETPPDGTRRLFISEQVGVVHIYYKNGSKIEEPFMDITHMVLTSTREGDERGFLGLAFHPDFQNNKRFFTFFSISSQNEQRVRISEFRVSDNDPNKVDDTSEQILLEVNQPYWNHNGGELLFGDDGYLYVFLGDGGAAGDPHQHAQNKSVLLGKVLRLDVDLPMLEGMNYNIPNDNPFVNEVGTRPEIFAYGIRNTWRCDVDEGNPTTGENKGRIICGDVGQDAFEEINIIESGGNYGWNSREGFECFNEQTCGQIGPEILPIYAYPHRIGKSVTGGHVYRGCMNPNLNGKYLYGDFVYGKLFMLDETSSNSWTNTDISMCGADVCFNGLVSEYETNILSFGEDDNGEIYMLTTSDARTNAPVGRVYRFVDPRRRGDPSSCKTYRLLDSDGDNDSTSGVNSWNSTTDMIMYVCIVIISLMYY